MKLYYSQNIAPAAFCDIGLPMTIPDGNIKPRSLRASRLYRREGQYGW